MEYWHKNFRCPWYYHNGSQQIGCMVGNLKFPDKLSAVEVMDNYCVNDWEECAIAKALNNWEERKYKEREYERSKKKTNSKRTVSNSTGNVRKS